MMPLRIKVVAKPGEIFDQVSCDMARGRKIDTKDFGKAVVKDVEPIDGGKAAFITIEPKHTNLRIQNGSHRKRMED